MGSILFVFVFVCLFVCMFGRVVFFVCGEKVGARAVRTFRFNFLCLGKVHLFWLPAVLFFFLLFF